MLYKPHLAEKLSEILNQNVGPVDYLMTCCRHIPQVEPGKVIINICPGCDKRFGKDYEGVSTISLWEILAGSDFFPFPDYGGRQMTILDACPTREKVVVHEAIRTLLRKMNIGITEPAKTGTRGTCCGDSFYGAIPVEKVKDQMVKRASEMPCEDVVVYCVTCVKSMQLGGKRPHYLVDLLFGEGTEAGNTDPDWWHGVLDEYISEH